MNHKTLQITLLTVMIFTAAFSQNKMERIKVSGNSFVTESGKTIVFRGLNTSDPEKLKSSKSWNFLPESDHWNKDYFKEMKRWGANIVRIPVHPTSWTRLGKETYLKLLDQGIEWAEDLGLYVIIDWHSIGNLRTEMFQADMYDTTIKQTYDFWRTIAKRYGDHNTVAFYEIFNEPTTYNKTLGTLSWDYWKGFNEEVITIIRANGGKGIPLIAGFNWAYDLTPAKGNYIDAENIAYVSHPYPQKTEKPWEDKWTQTWGFIKEKYPLILTEIGFCDKDEPGAHVPVLGDESYGDAITNYCDSKGISYVIWVFDPNWSPMLFHGWDYKPSRHGKYFKKKLQSYKY